MKCNFFKLCPTMLLGPENTLELNAEKKQQVKRQNMLLFAREMQEFLQKCPSTGSH